MTFTGYGIYNITHACVPNVCLAPSASPNPDECPIVIWDVNSTFGDQMWLIESISDEADTYTIRSITTGLYLGLQQGSSADGTLVMGFKQANHESLNWIIRQGEGDGSQWRIQNRFTHTFLDVHDGDGKGAHVVGGTGSWDDSDGAKHQHWLFELLSQTGAVVHATLQASPTVEQDFKSYLSDGLYLVLQRDAILQIWLDSGLAQSPYRDTIFDCDDFATVYKAEVSKWGNKTFNANGFALLCGLMYGSNKEGDHAYNWTLDPTDFSRVIFFDPQEGSFSSKSAYEAYFGLF